MEVPSAGDWSVHRGAAVFIEAAHNITITHCLFNQTGGKMMNSIVEILNFIEMFWKFYCCCLHVRFHLKMLDFAGNAVVLR